MISQKKELLTGGGLIFGFTAIIVIISIFAVWIIGILIKNDKTLHNVEAE